MSSVFLSSVSYGTRLKIKAILFSIGAFWSIMQNTLMMSAMVNEVKPDKRSYMEALFLKKNWPLLSPWTFVNLNLGVQGSSSFLFTICFFLLSFNLNYKINSDYPTKQIIQYCIYKPGKCDLYIEKAHTSKICAQCSIQIWIHWVSRISFQRILISFRYIIEIVPSKFGWLTKECLIFCFTITFKW